MSTLVKGFLYSGLVIVLAFLATVALGRSGGPGEDLSSIAARFGGVDRASSAKTKISVFDSHDQTDLEASLARLAADEATLLAKNAPQELLPEEGLATRDAVEETADDKPAAPETILPMAENEITPSAYIEPTSTTEFDTALLLEEKKALEAQQEKLVNEIVEFRKQIRALKERSPEESPRNAQLEREAEEAKREAAVVREKYNSLKTQSGNVSALEEERTKLRQIAYQLRDKVAQLELELEQKKSIEHNNGYLRAELKDLQQRTESIEAYKAANERLKSQGESAERELKNLSEQLATERARVKELEGKLDQEVNAKIALSSQLRASGSEAAKQEQELNSIKRELSRSVDNSQELQAKLVSAESRLAHIADLEREVLEAKNALLLKETEVRSLTENKSKNGTARSVATPTERSLTKRPPVSTAIDTGRGKLTDPSIAESDVLIAVVTAEKANLRNGPSQNHAPVMTVQRGMRLTVETKKGSWYRVITPHGNRAYVDSTVVRLENGAPEATAVKRVDDDNVYVPFGTETKKSENDAVVDDVMQAFEKLKSGVRQNAEAEGD